MERYFPMKWFYDLRIATKLITSFLVVLALTAVMGVFSIIQLNEVNGTTIDIRENWMSSMRAASGMRFRSEEHTSELQSLMRISYAVFCLKKKKLINHLTISILNTICTPIYS